MKIPKITLYHSYKKGRDGKPKRMTVNQYDYVESLNHPKWANWSVRGESHAGNKQDVTEWSTGQATIAKSVPAPEQPKLEVYEPAQVESTEETESVAMSDKDDEKTDEVSDTVQAVISGGASGARRKKRGKKK